MGLHWRVSEAIILRQSLSIGTVEISAEVLCEEKPMAGLGVTEAEVDSAYRAWSKRAREQWGEYVKWEKRWLEKHPDSSAVVTARDGGALDSIRQWSGRHPMTVSATFDNEAGPDFSRIFEEAPRLPDTPATRKRLKDYAMHLREVISKRDGVGLYREISPAQNASYRQAGKTPPPDSTRLVKWKNAARTKSGWFADVRGATAFERAQVGVRPWVDGRVWELYRRPGEPLFGGWKIYVGEMGGELKVVRLE